MRKEEKKKRRKKRISVGERMDDGLKEERVSEGGRDEVDSMWIR